jgi:hypothetical protein
MPCALDRLNKLALVLGTRSRDALWDNFPLLGNEPLELLLIFVVNIELLCIAKAAGSLLTRGLFVAFATVPSNIHHDRDLLLK